MNNYKMHVISHTHWDREWHRPFQSFRMRLVALIDDVLHLLDTDPDYRFFHMDGQTSMVEDYLAIRPENEEKIRRYVQEGRILIGPWYVQPDEYLVSGESLIRNLLKGHSLGAQFGPVMKIGYVPDTFGHVSQLPQILQGFAIDNAFFFRGITADQVKSEFIWKGADGTSLLAVKLPDNQAYSNFFYSYRQILNGESPLNMDTVLEATNSIVKDRVEEGVQTRHLLFMDGVDHVFPNPLTPEIVRLVNEGYPDGEMIHTTLPLFLEELKQDLPVLNTVQGELRGGNRCWWLQALFTNVLSSRIHLKQLNHRVEHLLEKWVEPFAAWAWSQGATYPEAFLDKAWQYLLQNQPHDSICGCSVDQVHKDMLYRYDQALIIGQELLDESLRYLASAICPGTPGHRGLLMVLFNALPYQRSETVVSRIQFRADENLEPFELLDPAGNTVPYQILDYEELGEMIRPDKAEIPGHTLFKFVTIAFLAENVPACGYAAYSIRKREGIKRYEGGLVTGAHCMENPYLKVEINGDGTLTVTDKATGQIYRNLGTFEDDGDAGDGYWYRPPMLNSLQSSQGRAARITLLQTGPVLAQYRIDISLSVPESLTADKRSRGGKWVDLPISMTVSLGSRAKRVDLQIEVNNLAKDHRLRVCFPTGAATALSWAESAFDVVSRPVKPVDSSEWIEPQWPTYPQKGFVDVSDDVRGLAVINEGLPEYEVKDEPDRTIAVTLLRATGGGVTNVHHFEEGQIQGVHHFSLALYPHAGNWETADVHLESYRHNTPMRAVVSEATGATASATGSFLEIGPANIVLSAVKRCETRNTLLVRLCNLTDKPTEGWLQFGRRVDSVYRLNLAEQRVAELPSGSERFDITVAPKEIVTLEIA